jgi:hypothetical protein
VLRRCRAIIDSTAVGRLLGSYRAVGTLVETDRLPTTWRFHANYRSGNPSRGNTASAAANEKLDNRKATCALHFAYYNFCRTHKSLGATPAMKMGLTDQI